MSSCAKPPFASQETLLMGILNITPDSFSDGGKYASAPAALAQAKVLIQQGAQILDIGGESTRPGAPAVPPAEEQRRIIPIISEIKNYAASSDVPISVDTMHADTAGAALKAGATIINDVSGFNIEPAMLQLVANNAVPYILTHNRGTPQNMDSLTDYGSRPLTLTIIDQLHTLVDRLLNAGILHENIIIDPGFGFSKTLEQNWELFKNLGNFIGHFKDHGYPTLVGVSRKRFLGALLRPHDDSSTLNHDIFVALTTLKAAEEKAWAVRVHDIPANRAAIDFYKSCY